MTWLVVALTFLPVAIAMSLSFYCDHAANQSEAGISQIHRDLEWWITESESADSPFYRHVCEDMVAYLRDMGATPPHPSFKDGVRIAKPGTRPYARQGVLGR